MEAFAAKCRAHPPNTKIELQMIVTKYNVNEVDKVKTKANALFEGCNFVARIKYYSTFASNVEDVSPSKTPVRRFSCRKPWEAFAIHSNGLAVLCCRVFDQDDKEVIMGDVNKQSIAFIWNSPLYEDMRDSFKSKKFPKFCQEC